MFPRRIWSTRTPNLVFRPQCIFSFGSCKIGGEARGCSVLQPIFFAQRWLEPPTYSFGVLSNTTSDCSRLKAVWQASPIDTARVLHSHRTWKPNTHSSAALCPLYTWGRVHLVRKVLPIGNKTKRGPLYTVRRMDVMSVQDQGNWRNR